MRVFKTNLLFVENRAPFFTALKVAIKHTDGIIRLVKTANLTRRPF